MSAVFEILIYQKNIIRYKDILKVLNQYKLNFILDSFEIMDNWLYDNLQTLDVQNISSIKESVKEGKIVQLSGIVNEKYRCGIQIHTIEEEIYAHNIWISSKEFPQLDNNCIYSENKKVYDLITNLIIDNISYNELIFASLGAEISLNYDAEYGNMIQASRNINRWITTKDNWEIYLNKYDQQEKNDIHIFSLYK